MEKFNFIISNRNHLFFYSISKSSCLVKKTFFSNVKIVLPYQNGIFTDAFLFDRIKIKKTECTVKKKGMIFMKKRYRLWAVVLSTFILCMPSGPMSAEEVTGVVNGSFETIENGEASGWEPVETTWEEILQSDGASGKGDNYILLSATDTAKNFGVKQNVKIGKGQTVLLSFFYKSAVRSALTLDLNFYDSAAPVSTSIATQKKELASTNGNWEKFNLILAPVESQLETDDGIYYAAADSVTLMFRNISKALGTAVVDVGIDAVSITPYDNLILDGGFEDAEADWPPTEKNGGDVTFENGYVKITGAAANAYVSQSTSVATSDMSYGFPLTRFRLSLKFKADNETAVPYIKIYEGHADNTEKELTPNQMRIMYTEDCEDGWKRYFYYSTVSTTAASKIGVMLRGQSADYAVYYDDVELVPADYWIYDYSTSGFKDLTALTSGKLTVSAIVANRTDAAIDANVVVAFYEVKNGTKTLLSVKMQSKDAVAAQTASECKVENVAVPATQNGGTLEMRCFVLNGMQPISTAKVLTQ